MACLVSLCGGIDLSVQHEVRFYSSCQTLLPPDSKVSVIFITLPAVPRIPVGNAVSSALQVGMHFPFLGASTSSWVKLGIWRILEAGALLGSLVALIVHLSPPPPPPIYCQRPFQFCYPGTGLRSLSFMVFCFGLRPPDLSQPLPKLAQSWSRGAHPGLRGTGAEVLLNHSYTFLA